jgi:hypothetical protein
VNVNNNGSPQTNVKTNSAVATEGLWSLQIRCDAAERVRLQADKEAKTV